jgi:hypothetical protein
MSLKSKILAFLSAEETEVIALGEMKLENGTVLVSEDFKEGMPVFIKSEDEDGEDVKLPVGEYQLEGGKALTVEVEGEIASIAEPKLEEESTEEPTEEPTEEMAQDGEEDKMAEDGEETPAMDPHMQEMHDRLDALEQAVMAMSQPAEELEAEVPAVELSTEEPAKEELTVEPKEDVAPIAHSPEATNEKRATFYFPKN